MAQLLPKGVDEQSPDPLKLNAAELERQWAVTPDRKQPEDHVDDSNNSHHGKSSVLHKFKDKAKRLKDKVKKNITGHHESSGEEEESEKEQDDSPQELDENAEAVRRTLAGLGTFGTRDILNKHDMSYEEATKANEKQELQARRDDVSTEETLKGNKVRDILNRKDDVSKERTMKANEHPSEELFHCKETKEEGGKSGNAILITEKEKIETDVDIPSLRKRAGEAMAEATETMLGLGKGRQQQGGGGEETPMSSTVKDMEAVTSVEDHSDAKPERAEPQISWGARASEEVGPAKEKTEDFGAPIGPNSADNSEDDSQSLAPKTQRKVSELGQGNEVASNEIPPIFTEEIGGGEEEPMSSRVKDNVMEVVASLEDHFDAKAEKVEPQKSWGARSSEVGSAESKRGDFGAPIGPNLAENSEHESQRLAPKTQHKVSELAQGNEVVSNEIPPNFTEEIGGGEEKHISSRVKNNVMELAASLEDHFDAKPEKAEPQRPWGARPSKEVGPAESRVDFGAPIGPNSAEIYEDESQSLAPKTQHKVSQLGQVNEMASNEIPPNFTEEIGGGEEKHMPSRAKDNVMEVVASPEDHFDAMPEKAEPQKSWGARSSKEVGPAESKRGDFGAPVGPNSAENSEDESQSLAPKTQHKVSELGQGNEVASNKIPPNFTEERGGEEKPMSSRVKDNVMEAVASVEDHVDAKPEKAWPQKSWGARSSEEVGPTLEKRGDFGAPIGPNSAENSEDEWQSLAPKTQEKVSERGQGSEMGFNEMPPNFTEEIKAGASELGSRVMSKASELVQGFKDVVASDKSSKDKEGETLIEGECKANGGKGAQQQQGGAQATGGQSYAQKLYAAKDAIASNLGYGGKENTFAERGEKLYAAKDAIASKLGYGGKENNFVDQGEQIQGAKEKQETFKGVIVSKLSPGEDEKALSEVITDAFNHGAKSVKDYVHGGFYGSNGNPKASSSSASDGIVEAFHDNDCQNSDNNPLREKGMRDSVTGVVSSLVGRIHGEDGDRYPSSDEPEPKSVVGTVGTSETTVTN